MVEFISKKKTSPYGWNARQKAIELRKKISGAAP